MKTYDKENIMIINTLTDQGISYCRNDLKIFCKSTNLKHIKKLVVLDDIDFITDQNQQVLRNYIDNYNKNVNFLCTGTSSQKIIESIQSRLLIIQLNDIKISDLRSVLDNICLKEKIALPNDCRSFIANNCGKSIQNLITCLEKCKLLGSKTFDLPLVVSLCTNMNHDGFKQYIQFCKSGNLHLSIKKMYDIFDSGYSVIDILDSLFVFTKNSIEIEETIKYKIIKSICKYITIFYNFHENELELASFTNELINLYK